MAFLEDPRLRQRWNQIAHDAEAVTENAAAGIWSFQHNYINPCFGSVADSIDRCTTVCLGDPEDRVRRRRERERSSSRAEYNFDFYDDWYEEEETGGLLGNWGGEDWDRLLAGTGSQRKHTGETTEQPRRKRVMSYGTRGSRRKASNDDPTIIPRTQPIGFLSKLPWKVGGTLRYKPSAADLQDHPQKQAEGGDESEPLLSRDDEPGFGDLVVSRKRSGTTGSGETSNSWRSRGDLFPSDGEGEEDAIPLADEVTFDMVRKDDRSSGKTRSSKGKRPVDGFASSRTVSRTTIGSTPSRDSLKAVRSSASLAQAPDFENIPTLRDLEMEEQRLQQEEDEEVARKKEAARQLAAAMKLDAEAPTVHSIPETKPEVAEDEVYQPEMTSGDDIPRPGSKDDTTTSAAVGEDGDVSTRKRDSSRSSKSRANFVPARLPMF